MDVDGLTDAGSKTYTDEEWQEYAAQIHQQSEELSYMGKGKGKGSKGGGKGKRTHWPAWPESGGGTGKDCKGGGKDGKGGSKGHGVETRTCHNCGKV